MAGRNLFATETAVQTKGRNLFAEPGVDEQPKIIEGAQVTRFEQPEQAQPQQENILNLGMGTQGELKRLQQLRAEKDIKSVDLPPSEPGINLKGLPEAALTVASGAVAEPVAGLAGIAGTLLPGEEGQGAEFVEKTREALTFKPRSEEGKQALGKIGEAAENIPEIGKAMGDFTFDITGSPILATLAASTPTLIGELLGLRGLKSLKSGTKLKDATGKPTNILKTMLDKEGLDFDLLSDQAKSIIPNEIEPGFIKSTSKKTISENAIVKQIESGAKDDSLALIKVDNGRIINDKLAKEALKQGFSEGFIQAIKTSSKSTKKKMLEMSSIMRRIKKNERLALDMRPSDIIGNSVTDRIKFIVGRTRAANKELNSIANTKLKGQKINTEDVVKTLNNSVEDLDVKMQVGSNGIPEPVFEGSLISKDRSSQKVIKDLISIMGEDVAPDALRFHKLKRQLDIMIDFNKKSAMGLSDAGKNVLKDVRRSLNDSLRAANPDYANVNDILSESIGVLNDLDKSVGSIDILGTGSNKALGQKMRALLSNQQGRIKMDNALNDINALSNKFGGRFDDDIKDLVLFADGLDNRFGTTAKTSFAGQITQAAQEAQKQIKNPSVIDAAATVIGKGIDKAKGVNDFSSFQSLESILRRTE